LRHAPDRVAAAFMAACLDELQVPKPGNVHVGAAGHRMTAADFERSAEAAAGPITMPGARVGARILSAVEATLSTVGMNTNLGIILLCAPLAAAAQGEKTDLRSALTNVLRDLDIHDAELAFQAIRQASPAGLGRVDRYDVAEPATVSLRAAMAEASERDRIARQYVSDFDDVFRVGEPLLQASLEKWTYPKWAGLAVYLHFLSDEADTHVVRKWGAAIGEEVRLAGVTFHRRMQAVAHPAELLPELISWDASLKDRNINPGTSADLTVATLFAHRLRNDLPPVRNSD
jgi:triphosphoribosyl-dephospho-CoA synthase